MKKKQAGPFLNVTTADGELIERIDLSGVNLSKPMARDDLMGDIIRAVTRAAIAKAEGK
jgi:hypothetical protein